MTLLPFPPAGDTPPPWPAVPSIPFLPSPGGGGLRWSLVVAGMTGEPLGFECVAPLAAAQGRRRAWFLGAAANTASTRPFGLIFARLSAPWFGGPGLVATIAELLERSGLDPARLQLMVDERTVNLAPEAVAFDLERLRPLGVGLALDRFGAGTASLTALSTLPVDRVRLAPSMIAGLGHCRRKEATIRSLIHLAGSLGLRVCALGVETEAQLAILQAYGCDELQGPLIGDPVEAPPGSGKDRDAPAMCSRP